MADTTAPASKPRHYAPRVQRAYPADGTWRASCVCGANWEGERTRKATIVALREACHVRRAEALAVSVELNVREAAAGDLWSLVFARNALRDLAAHDPEHAELLRLTDLVTAAGELRSLQRADEATRD